MHRAAAVTSEAKVLFGDEGVMYFIIIKELSNVCVGGCYYSK